MEEGVKLLKAKKAYNQQPFGKNLLAISLGNKLEESKKILNST